jgi:hypothetical protein
VSLITYYYLVLSCKSFLQEPNVFLKAAFVKVKVSTTFNLCSFADFASRLAKKELKRTTLVIYILIKSGNLNTT